MTVTITIPDLPEEVVEELRVRADIRGQTLEDYILEWMIDQAKILKYLE